MISKLKHFSAEMTRRHVYKVGAAYVVVGLGVLGAAELILDPLGLGEVRQVVVVLTLLGFPLALVLAWAYDIRPDTVAESGSVQAEAPTDRPATVQPDDSIVVLPFANLSPDPENEYFADGMTEEIINALANVSGLRVIARTSSFAFKGSSQDVREIGQRLGVATVLEGSLRRSGDRLRITAQLIDVTGGHHLWSERYDRELDDVFAIQDEIAQIIAGRLKPGAERAAARGSPTDNFQAYEALLRGRFHYAKATTEEYARSVEEYERAVSLDPDLAEAYTGLANAWTYLALLSDAGRRVPLAKAAALKALELDPGSADAHATLGMIACFYEWDWDASFRSFERAVQLNPGSAMARHDYAGALGNLGMASSAVEHARRCVLLDPLSAQANHILAFCLWVAQDFDEAIEYDDRAIELAPGFVYAHGVRAFALMEAGRAEEAEVKLRAFLERSPEEPLIRAAITHVYMAMGRKSDALDQLRMLEERSEEPDGAIRQSLAQANAAVGDVDEALRWIERGMEARDSFIVGLGSYRWWDPLRSDPRFAAIVGRLDFPDPDIRGDSGSPPGQAERPMGDRPPLSPP